MLVETGRAEGMETREGLDGSGEGLETQWTRQRGLEAFHLPLEVGVQGGLGGGHGGHTRRRAEEVVR